MKRTFLFWLALPLMAVACHRSPPPGETRAQPTSAPAQSAPAARAAATPDNASPPARPDFAVDAVATQEGDALWYDVPEQSLPQRKAWAQELTAASDTLPQNSYARVRRLDGKGEPVIVRITDTGVQRKGTLIDVNHAAAEALGILKSGEARVRVETLALRNASMDKPVEKKDEPTAPKLTNTPAVSQQAEKDAANAKPGGSPP